MSYASNNLVEMKSVRCHIPLKVMGFLMLAMGALTSILRTPGRHGCRTPFPFAFVTVRSPTWRPRIRTAEEERRMEER